MTQDWCHNVVLPTHKHTHSLFSIKGAVNPAWLLFNKVYCDLLCRKTSYPGRYIFPTIKCSFKRVLEFSVCTIYSGKMGRQGQSDSCSDKTERRPAGQRDRCLLTSKSCEPTDICFPLQSLPPYNTQHWQIQKRPMEEGRRRRRRRKGAPTMLWCLKPLS